MYSTSKTRRGFFVAMSVLLAIIVFVGFGPTFYLRSTFNPGKALSILLHVHGLVFSTWIVLFVVQTVLIVRGSPALHRRLGWFMAVLAIAMVVLMGAAIVEQMRRVPPAPPAPFALAFGGFDILVFATLVGTALHYRKRPDWHKRLMLSATILLVEAAAVRIVVFHGVAAPSMLVLSELLFALLAFALCFIYDAITRRRIHPAFVLGLALILADQGIQPLVLSWPPWTSFANAVQRLVV